MAIYFFLQIRLTSRVHNKTDDIFLNNFFSKLEGNQKQYILLIDEVYVKSMLTYHGGILFGNAVNDPSQLATTVLGFMLVSSFGGSSFLVKMLPVNKLDSTFLFEQTENLLRQIRHAGGEIIAIICDNNRVNQAFFKMFDLVSPWQTRDNIFLLFDFVHIVKSIRNNWLTEKTGEIEFGGQIAKWSDITKLEKLEADSKEVVKLSRLNYVAAHPKPVERQNVNTALRVFCDQTVTALENHSQMTDIEGTVDFMKKVVLFWNMCNVKSKEEDVRFNDKRRAAVKNSDDTTLDKLDELADFAQSLREAPCRRMKKLTQDTSNAWYHTCKGMVALCRYLLSTSHSYVLLGKFTTDPIERAFGQLRQGSGGTYFINVQQILEKVNINKTRMLLRANPESLMADPVGSEGHKCDRCNFNSYMDQYLCNIFDTLPEHEDSLSEETKQSLVYVAGYVFRKDQTTLTEGTDFYFKKYGKFTTDQDRGGLTYPNDCACQWTFFCYIIFQASVESVCRNSLVSIFHRVSLMHHFQLNTNHARTLANVFFNNYCKVSNKHSTKEGRQKLLKLS